MTGRIFVGDTAIEVDEDHGTLMVPVTRTGDLSGTATITFGFTGNTATAGLDFTDTNVSHQASFAVGEDTIFIPVQINNNSEVEPTETFTFSLVGIDGTSELGFPRTTRIDIIDAQNPDPNPTVPPLVSNFTVTAETRFAGTENPIAFEFSPQTADFPNELVYVAGKGGVINVYNFDTGTFVSTFIDISSKVNEAGDRGLLDIALDPNFGAAHPYIYAFYTYDPPETANNPEGANDGKDGQGNRFSYVVRFTADAATGFTTVVPGSEKILLGGAADSLSDISGGGAIDSNDPDNVGLPASDIDNSPNGVNGYKQDYLKIDSLSHVGGSLVFGADGMLYVSTGDGVSFDTVDPRGVSVQSVDALAGKILRIDPETGQGLADNPFYDGDLDHNASKVWDLGLRNPYAVALEPDGSLLISETGWSSWEEINKDPGTGGLNFGWPFFEGGDLGQLLQTSGYEDLPDAQAFYQKVIDGDIVITPAYRAFSHDEADPGFQIQAIVGSNTIYLGNNYPASLNNSYFFTDVAQGELYFVNADNPNDLQFLSLTDKTVVHFAEGPDGYMYYADLYGDVGRFLIADNSGPPNDTYQVTEDQTLTVNVADRVLLNDYLPGTPPAGATVTLGLGPVHGNLTLNANGTFTYTPNANFFGFDQFTYTAHNGAATQDATVTLVVNNVNDPPIAVDDDATAVRGVLETINVLLNDTDADNDILTVQNVTAASGSLVYVDGFLVKYLASPGTGATDTLTYTIIDGNGGQSTAHVNITLSDSPNPIATDDQYFFDEDSTLTTPSQDAPGVFDNDYLIGLTPNAQLITNVAHGTLALSANGNFTYTPDANFHGVDTFTYKNTAGGGSDPATVELVVGSVNDDPVTVDDNAVSTRGTPVTFDVVSNDTDADLDILTVIAASSQNGASVVVNADSTITYLALAGVPDNDIVTYTVIDGNGGQATGHATITNSGHVDVIALDDNVFANDTGSLIQSAANGVLANDMLLGQANLVVSAVNGSAANIGVAQTLAGGGTVTVFADGSYVFNSNGKYEYLSVGKSVTEVVGVTVKEPDGSESSAPLNITVLGQDNNDIFTGTNSADVFYGGNGNDQLIGFAGRDLLYGGNGNDIITGGRDRDTMTGGAGNDVFKYKVIGETGKTSSTRDVITDYRHGQDKIDLRDIDASTKKSGNQNFTFIGQQDFHHTPGEVHFLKVNKAGSANDYTVVEGDVNGDGKADFQIQLKGLITMTKADFIL